MFFDVDQRQQESGGERHKADRHVEAQGAHEHHRDEEQREDLLSARTAGPGGVDVGMLAAFAVAQPADEGEQDDGEDRENEIQGETGSKKCALGDGKPVLEGDVVHQDAGHGQRGKAAGMGSVDDERAHQHGMDAGLVGEADGRRCQQRDSGRREGTQ
ncbi:hypothetical protein D9M72_461310 [compost metagenome]